MKRNRPFTLTLPQPCSENWEEMTPTEKGRFCLNCQKTVIDFSAMGDRQVVEVINGTQGQVCGRFYPQQLNREFAIADQKRTPFIPIAALVSALYFFLPSARAQRVSQTVPHPAGEKDAGIAPLIRQPTDTPTVLSRTNALRTIIGFVYSSNKEALPAVTVMTLPANERIGTLTDVTGKFRLTVPITYTKDTLLLKVAYIGFEAQTFCLSLSEENHHIEVYLEPDTRILSVPVVTRKRSFWERLNIKSLFR
ncbi:carboxypeptidase-like regulatory domain-containing protein [Chitinophaga filiformis]|uniref:carboxypeptidase-like regulatory domain-containing protein n=1 Tax=Chitinophaga filiformis TaxID=104663 RepID=UPI001F197100|nr:carboxypeptidase-like regulatory domain-containing protein [Chitinophaga filiformis]MCF6402279.1 carboxypeptidase-like regulatory domain-containing protein [Chitinophaga filiformis]